MTTELDKPPPGWHVVAVMRKRSRGWDWVALMVPFDPDAPDAQWQATRGREAYVAVPGKHRSYDDACTAVEEMLVTRH